MFSDLVDCSEIAKDLLYVISLDGPQEINDNLRGEGVYQRVLRTIEGLPSNFPHKVQCQCVVTRKNAGFLDRFVRDIQGSRFDHLTFSFYVASKNDNSENAWPSLEERDEAVSKVIRLKQESGGFIRNRQRSLELMLSKNHPIKTTEQCLARRSVLPLYLRGKSLVTTFCCYGNNIRCDDCGAWIVFELAARSELPTWKDDPFYYD